MSLHQSIEADEAIRRVIAAGRAGDYLDVVQQVKDDFHQDVSQGQVERVYLQLKRELGAERAAPATSSSTPDPRGTATTPDEGLGAALRFVQEVGGFESARAALARLEAALSKLRD